MARILTAEMAAQAHQHTALTTAAVAVELHLTPTVLNTEAPAAPVVVAMADKVTSFSQHQARQTPAVVAAVTITLLRRLAAAATLDLHITDHKDCHGAFCKNKQK